MLFRGSFGLGLGLGLWLTATSGLPAQASEDLGTLTKIESSRVDAAALEIMRRNHAPAISLAIVRNSSIAYLKAYGFAELPAGPSQFGSFSHGRRAAVTTRLAIGSLSKEFAAAAILLLVDRGKLSLDAQRVGRMGAIQIDRNRPRTRPSAEKSEQNPGQPVCVMDVPAANVRSL